MQQAVSLTLPGVEALTIVRMMLAIELAGMLQVERVCWMCHNGVACLPAAACSHARTVMQQRVLLTLPGVEALTVVRMMLTIKRARLLQVERFFGCTRTASHVLSCHSLLTREDRDAAKSLADPSRG